MKPLSALKPSDLANIKMVSFDVDGVLVEKGTEIFEIQDLNKDNVLVMKTKHISPELVKKIERLKKYLHVNISSGRSLLYLIEAFNQILWNNASLQSENGLFTLIAGKVIQNTNLNFEELAMLRKIREEIYKMKENNPNIRGFEPKQFLLSVHCFNEDPSIVKLVEKLGLNKEYSVKWSSEAYNIFPSRISKLTGLKALTKLLNIDISQVLVVGNDPNDKEAAEGPGISVTTDPSTLTAEYYIESKSEIGGGILINRLLEIFD